MSEFMPIFEGRDRDKHLEEPEQRRRELSEAERRHEHLEALESIKLRIEQESLSGGEMALEKEPEMGEEANQSAQISEELRQEALADTLTQTRRHLPKAQRRLSKVIHQPTVEKVSDIAARTVFRPSALLGGASVALIGSLVLLYVANHYGYEYPFSAFLMLLGAGFSIGIIIELLGRLLTKR